MLDERMRAVLCDQHDIKDIRIDTVRQREIDDAVFACKWNGRFGAFRRQDTQAGAFSASQNDAA